MPATHHTLQKTPECNPVQLTESERVLMVKSLIPIADFSSTVKEYLNAPIVAPTAQEVTV